VALEAFAGYEKLKKENEILKATLKEKDEQLQSERFNNMTNREYIKNLENALNSIRGSNPYY
jgi:hypothetical protein